MINEFYAVIRNRVIKLSEVDWKSLQFIQQEDFKEWIDAGDEKLIQSLLKYQFVDPFKVWEHEGVIYCLDGYHRVQDLKRLVEGGTEVPAMLPATFIACENKQEAAELVLVYSSQYARITREGLSQFIELQELSWDSLNESISLPDMEDIDLGSLIDTEGVESDVVVKSLKDRFLIPPFSILDTRQGYWQDRKKTWHSLGINSQETREGVELIAKSGQSSAIYELRNKMRTVLNREPSWDEIIAEAKRKGLHVYEGASVFDPVLTEVAYRWFCPEGGTILDPFAGGSVRGIVAGLLGFQYHGIDLRFDQVNANMKQANELKAPGITWYTGDSLKMDELLPDDLQFDFVFSCPPYHDLEKYSDDPSDLSNMSYCEFLSAYRSIITKAISRLKQDRFACFVVGDVRDTQGAYRNFVSDTIDCFVKCIDDSGNYVKYYNEIILINVAGSLPIRVGRQFESGRKVGKMHQNVLVFYKGDPKKIKGNFPEINIDELLAQVE